MLNNIKHHSNLLGSYSADLELPATEVFSEIQQCIGAANFKVHTIVPNQTVIAEGKRNFSWALMIILIILIWPAAIIYYFTREKSSITATITSNEKGCLLSLTSNGSSGNELLALIKDIFQKDGKD